MDVLLILAPFLIFLLFLVMRNLKAEQSRSEVWSEIARQAGLSFLPGSSSLLLLGLPAHPEIRGEYRGRYVSLRVVRINAYESGWEYTEISLQANNPTGCLLTIRPKGLLRGKSQPSDLTTRNEQFDRLFVVQGQPREYVQKAVALIARSDPHLLASLASCPPEIRLIHSQLTCSTSERASVHEYVTLLSLLCDIAQIADEMGTETDASLN